MKKILFGTAIAICSLSAQAKDYGAAGCGLGSILFEGQSGVGPHVLAATTNNFYGTQTFAMTSGTLGCDATGTIQSHTAFYIDSNLEGVASASAAGEGEALVVLAELMGIEQQDRAQFNSTLKSHFAQIFPSADVSSEEVMASLISVMKSDASLSKYVS